jgi:hypothetical protein
MPKIFLSHAHEDKEAAHQVARALTSAGLDPWLDVQELRSGDGLLQSIATVLGEAEYFVLLLSRTALTKRWVLAEMRMALTAEIEKGRPRVIVLRLDDCEVPIELRHKVHLDFRGRFDDALKELVDHIKGGGVAVPPPKQTILAEMIAGADAELWDRLTAGAGGHDEFTRAEAANAIRDLRTEELEAAVAIGSMWSGRDYKTWEADLLATIRRAVGAGDARAGRIIKRLADAGFLAEARDLDYRKQRDSASCDQSLLWILSRAARRSGLFPSLPPPLPERLSRLLDYERPVDITGKGWYAVKFAKPVATALDTASASLVAVARHAEPSRTWVFRSSDDRTPLVSAQYFTPTDLTPSDPFASLAGDRDLELVGFDLATFDDLGLLKE